MAEARVTETMIFRANLGARIGFCVDKIGKKREAASFAGITPEQLNKWIKGTVRVPVEGLRDLSRAASIDFSWLATGQGSAPAGGPIQVGFADDQASAGKDVVPASLTDLDQPGMIAIPRYDEVRPSAGAGATVAEERSTTRVAFEHRWLTEIGVQASSAVILPAQGDSMEPTIRNGSPMLVDTSKTEIRSGNIYVIAVGDDLLVKRVRRRLDGLIELISDNSAYAPETLAPDRLSQLRVIGRVYAAVSRL